MGTDGKSVTRIARTVDQASTDASRRWMVTVDGQRLRQVRRQHGLSRQALATAAGISTATIGRLERQEWPSCRGRTLARLAKALGEQATDLTQGGAH